MTTESKDSNKTEGVINGEDEEYIEKDDSRPFFQRQPCEVGIYMTVYDAKPVDVKSVGLDHYFRMHTTEVLYEEFCKMDTVNIRATLERNKVMTDTYIERFEPGIVMAVGFDTVQALDALWTLHRTEKLNVLMHELLITSGVLKAADIISVTLDTKLWDDEYDSCKNELMTRKSEILNLQFRPNDMKMVLRLKNYQQVIATEVSGMRDMDNEMDLNRNEFMNCVRNILPNDVTKITTLNDYDKLAKSPKARKMYYRDLLDLYTSIVDKWRENYKRFHHDIVTPLIQIHTVCENDKQKEIKMKIINSIDEMLEVLKPDTDLQEITHPEMSKKIIRRDVPVFLGLLSLVPLGVDKIAEIDILIDDYTREFKVELKV
ncbi:hypothetical protein ACF0H5_023216 [Mactra antiquata]